MLILATVPLALAASLRLIAAHIQIPLPSIDLDAAQELATAVLIIITPMMFGLAIGLMLLGERDEGILVAAAATPTGKTRFLIYRMTVPIICSVLATLVVVPLAGLSPIHPPPLAALALLAGLQAPLLPLFLGAFAADRVQGVGLAKVGTILIGIGALAATASGHWRWLAAPSPHFWSVRLFLDRELPAPIYATLLGVALLMHALMLVLLARLFEERTG